MKIRRVAPGELQHGREYVIGYTGALTRNDRANGTRYTYAGRYLRMSTAEPHVPVFDRIAYGWTVGPGRGTVSRFPPRDHTFWEVLE